MKFNKELLSQKIDFILNRLLIVFLFVILIIYGSREIMDLDLMLHLKTGEVIVANSAVPLHDIFSFTIEGKHWINHEWLFQVICHLIFSLGSWDGLIIMQNAVLIAIFLLFLTLWLKDNNHVVCFTVFYIMLLTMAYRFTIRPDIFSLFFLALYLFIIKRSLREDSKIIWVLPFLQIIWVNMHGFFFTGPLLVLIFLAGEITKSAPRLPYSWNQTQRITKEQMIRLILVFICLTFASFINPCGFRGAAYPLSVLGQISGEGKIFFKYIIELAKPITLKNILDINHFLYYKTFILISLFSFRFNQKNINISDLFLWAAFFFFSLIAVRNVAYFGLIAAYVTLNNFETAMDNKKKLPFGSITPSLKTLIRYCFIVFLFIFSAKGALKYVESSFYNFDTYRLKPTLWGLAERRYPEKAAKFLIDNNLPEHLYNDFNSGAYLIGATFPQRKVFIDGRTELYGPEFFKEYVEIGDGNREALEKTFKRYDIQGVFINAPGDTAHLGLLKFLSHSPLWKPVYFDDMAIIFLKNTDLNAALIKKFSFELKNWIPPQPEFLRIGVAYRYPSPYVSRGKFLNAIGFYSAAAREAKIALEIMPNCALALKFVADCYLFDKKDYPEAFKYARNCLIQTPGDLEARSRLALIYHMLKEEKKALKVIDALIHKAPKFSEAYYVKALILTTSDEKKAKELLGTAIKLAPKEPKYHDVLGDLWAKEGNAMMAQNEWKYAFSFDSTNEALEAKIKKKGVHPD